MAVAASDLRKLAAANRPTDDTSTSGGAISSGADLTGLEITDPVAPATLEILSDGTDTRQVTVIGRNAAGEEITAGPTALNGTTPVALSGTFERVSSVEVSAVDASRTVTVRVAGGGATVAVIPPTVRRQVRMFRNAASDPSEPRVRYEKEFWQNAHGSDSLLDAQVTLTADPGGKIAIGLAATKNDAGSVANRLTAPAGVTFVEEGVAQNVPGGSLAAGEAIGVWIRQSLTAGDAPVKSTFTTQLSGMTA